MRTWVKLYTEIIDDRKVARLTDRQFRLFALLMPLAGVVDKDGELPCADEIAWRLRLDGRGVDEDLQALAQAGIVAARGDGWLLSAFARRNPMYPSETNAATAERKRRSRARAKTGHEYVTTSHDVTSQSHDARQDIEQEQETEQEEIKRQTSSETRASNKPVDNSDDDDAFPGRALPALTAEQHVAMQLVTLCAPDFRDLESFVRQQDPRRVAFWALAAGRDIDRLENPAGLIRAMTVKGDWPDLPGADIAKYQAAVRSNTWRNNGNGKDKR